MVSSGAQHGANAPTRQQDVADALTYLDEMQRELAAQPRVYADFLQVLQDFRNNPELNTFMVIERVVALLRGRPRLLDGFNMFLPPGYRITTTPTATIVASPSGTQWYPLPVGNRN